MPTMPSRLKDRDPAYYRTGAMQALVEVEACNGQLAGVEKTIRAKHRSLDSGRLRVAMNNNGQIQALRADRAYWMATATMYAALAAMPIS